jgi:hypothetical protein
MSRSGRAGPVLASLALGLVAACGQVGTAQAPSATPAPSATAWSGGSLPPSGEPAPSAFPAPSGSPVPSGSPAPNGSPGASFTLPPSLRSFDPTRTLPPGVKTWPASVIDAAISLAVLDNEIKKAGADLIVGTDNEDLRTILGAADGLAQLAVDTIPDAEKLTTWDDTRAVGESYLPVLADVRDAAEAIGTSLRAGDTDAFVAALPDLTAAMDAYETIRGPMLDVAEMALTMRRGLLLR